VLRRAIAGATVVVLTFLCSARPAAAEDPLFVEWSSLLPTMTAGYDPSSVNDCKAGRIQCVDAVIREMTRRFDGLAQRCDHDAVFALTYLRTTEEYKRAATTPGFFEDPAFVNHEDAVFARYYFEAFDAWHRGDTLATPAAWRMAFDTADRRKATGSGNMLLGLSAHINRDLPFVLHDIGLVKPDGSTRKTDHDKVNHFLNRVTQPVIAEAARRLDPTMDDSNAPGTWDETATLQLVVAWREEAWRNAERLANAGSDLERSLVAASIESSAVQKQQALLLSGSYGLFENSSARDAFCAANWNAV
jgi:hypothetical protein